ncbi:MAG: hypothetical protein JWM56_460 [Candidatus Peribacteria bacterium]|nr:hypothetical protein [Candidatus Peribacteria bacterium]
MMSKETFTWNTADNREHRLLFFADVIEAAKRDMQNVESKNTDTSDMKKDTKAGSEQVDSNNEKRAQPEAKEDPVSRMTDLRKEADSRTKNLQGDIAHTADQKALIEQQVALARATEKERLQIKGHNDMADDTANMLTAGITPEGKTKSPDIAAPSATTSKEAPQALTANAKATTQTENANKQTQVADNQQKQESAEQGRAA